MTETAIVQKIIKYLRSKGAYVVKVHGSPLQPKTIDLIASYRGRFFGIEVKRPKLKATERQQHTLSEIGKSGGFALLAHSVNDVEPWLSYLDTGQIKVGAEVGLPIRDSRHKKTIKLLRNMVSRFDADFVVNVAAEIGLAESTSYTENGESLEFDLTSLQAVALASALRACWEFRGGTG